MSEPIKRVVISVEEYYALNRCANVIARLGLSDFLGVELARAKCPPVEYVEPQDVAEPLEQPAVSSGQRRSDLDPAEAATSRDPANEPKPQRMQANTYHLRVRHTVEHPYDYDCDVTGRYRVDSCQPVPADAPPAPKNDDEDFEDVLGALVAVAHLPSYYVARLMTAFDARYARKPEEQK